MSFMSAGRRRKIVKRDGRKTTIDESEEAKHSETTAEKNSNIIRKQIW